jgi:hypothetical protein
MPEFSLNQSEQLNNSSQLNLRAISSTVSAQMQPARVIEVDLGAENPDDIGAIKYKLLNSEIDERKVDLLPIAYPINSTVRQIPLKNEIVFLIDGPNNNIGDNTSNKRTYYMSVVSIWNHPQHNSTPVIDEDLQQPTVDLGFEIEEKDDIRPLQPFPGDLILDGRQGQSIRMTGYLHPLNPFTDLVNEGAPILYISNGQKPGETPFEPVVEDMNEDACSIFLGSNHIAPLKQANTKYDSYFTSKPDLSDTYRGSQIILNSGRLFLNAKEDHLLLSSISSVGLNGNSVNLDGTSYVSIDAPRIFLGKEAKDLARYREAEPAVKGKELERFLIQIVDVLIDFAESMRDAQTKDAQSIPSIQESGAANLFKLQTLIRPSLQPDGNSRLKSKKVFVE